VAFSDVRTRDNLNGSLAALVELRNTSGTVVLRLALADKWFKATFPSPWGEMHTSGVVESWGEFGMESDFWRLGQDLIVGDGTVTIGTQPIAELGLSMPLQQWLRYYLVNGSNLLICQCIENPATDVWEVESVFRGMVNHVRDSSSESLTLEFTDLSRAFAVVPPNEVTRVDFEDAPEDAIAARIPVVYGSFREKPNVDYPDLSSFHLMYLGMGNRRGYPIIPIDMNYDEDEKGPIYRMAGHELHDVGWYESIALIEPDLEHPCMVSTVYADFDNQATYCDVEIDEPVRAYVPVIPTQKGPDDSADSDQEKAWDLDATTTVTVTASGSTKQLHGKLQQMPVLGYVRGVLVQAWIKNTGSGSLRIGLKDDDNVWVGDTEYSSWNCSWASGTDKYIYHEVEVDGEPLQTWDWYKYNVVVSVQPSSEAEIVALSLRVQYVPNRRAVFARPNTTGGVLWPGGGKEDWLKYIFGLNMKAKLGGNGPSMVAYVEGMEDDGSGTYTGTPDAMIENAADVAHHFITTYSGLTSDDYVSGSSGLGNFIDARTELGSYHDVAMYLGEAQSSWDVLIRLCRQSRAIPIFRSDGKLGIVVIDPTPSADYNSGFKWYAGKHFLRESFKFGRTPTEDVFSRVFVEFDWSPQTDKFRKTAWVTADGSDNGFGTRDENGTGEREDQAGYADSIYRCEGEFRLKCYDIVNQGEAKAIRNFCFDNLCRTRLWIEFLCGRHACDLSVGNVIGLGDELINGLPPCDPYATSNNWDDYSWYVANVARSETRDEISQYRVFAVQAIEPATPSDWVSAADDT